MLQNYSPCWRPKSKFDEEFTSFSATLNKMTKTIVAAKESDVHVVSADVLENVKTEGIIAQIKNRAISDWGSDVSHFCFVKQGFFFVSTK